MKLAIFDLDNTLLQGDSDHAWGEFLISQGLVPESEYREKNNQYYADYKRGQLDMLAYQEFVLSPLKVFSADQLKELHTLFMQTVIQPMILPKALKLVNQHRELGHNLMVITATNRFITEPIVKEGFNIDLLLCTEPEIHNDKFTGHIQGIPCYQEGKIDKLREWVNTSKVHLDYTWFYSDSLNDIPLMEYVDEAIAVDADKALQAHAKKQGWAIISLRDN